MSLFNKLTIISFLVIMMAAFVSLPVMAHDPDDPAVGTTIGEHTHPVKVEVEAVDAGPGGTPPAVLAVPAHNHHPVVTSIVLKPDPKRVRGNMVAVGAAPDTQTTGAEDAVDANEFVLIVTFDRPIVAAADNTDQDAANPGQDPVVIDDADAALMILDAEITRDVRDKMMGLLADATQAEFTIQNVTWVNDKGPYDKLEVEVRAVGGVIPTGIAANDNEKVNLRLRIDAGAVFSAQTTEPDPDAAGDITIPGGASLESMFYSFVLVKELPTERDSDKPIVTLTDPPVPKDGKLEFSYDISTGDETGLDALITKTEIDVENGEVDSVDRENKKIIVTPDSATSKVTVTVMAGALTDAAGNTSDASNPVSHTPEGYVATITISSMDGEGDDDGKIVFYIDFSESVGSFDASDIEQPTNTRLLSLTDLVPVTAIDAMPFPEGVAERYKLTVKPTDATKAVMVTIRAGAVRTMDPPDANNMDMNTTDDSRPFNSAQKSHTLAAAPATDDGTISTDNTSPEFTIAAGGFIVIVRDTAGDMGTVIKTYDSSIPLDDWTTMPDLQNLFETGVPLTGPAHGGGALILSQSGTTAVHPGTVGISEIMWAIDESKLTDANARKADQWIELHNLNTAAVTVKLSWKTGAKDIAADTNINGNLAAPYLDVVTNVFHDRPGTAHWTLPGQNGNPVTSKNFVSAARKGTFILDSKHDNKFNKRYTRSDKGENASNSPDGRNKDQWAASTVRYAYRTKSVSVDQTQFNVPYENHGTPGRVNTFSPERADIRAGRTNVPINGVIFNEIANHSNKDYEWIELRNVSDGELNLRNYLISIVESKPAQADRDKTSDGNDKIFYQFPSDQEYKIAAGGVFLLVASDPRENPNHPLATGYNVDLVDQDQVTGSLKNPVHYKVMSRLVDNNKAEERDNAYPYMNSGLPDTGDFILILRKPDNHEGHRSGRDGGKGVAERGKDDLDKIVDIAGYHPDLKITDYPNAVSSTNLWPLRNFEALNFNRNQFSPDTVHHRTALATKGSHNDHRAAWQDAAYTGVGYKRKATNAPKHGGTPGHHGNITGKAADNKVIISEIMLPQGTRGNLPQWIELYNPSKTHAVNLADNAGWRLVIENPDRAPIITINFKDDGNVKVIPPNQTVLIVSSSARDYGADNLPRGTVFPNTRVLNAYSAIRGEIFELASPTSPLLNPAGFNIRLYDGKTANNKPDGRYAGEMSDEVGNLDGNVRTNDEPAWELPSGMTEDGNRTSLIRRFEDGMPLDGTMAMSWTRAVDTSGLMQQYVRHTWFGAESDHGTPADRTGSVLPVRLSHFRPTLEDGKVVIRWTTESELDNAGFNILRSDTRNGEFKQVNDKLIAGKGTTGERSTYNWVDATAKPGAVYYYQIEDVSFAGERQTLRTTKLKGYISAENKLTTTWGDLKDLR